MICNAMINDNVKLVKKKWILKLMKFRNNHRRFLIVPFLKGRLLTFSWTKYIRLKIKIDWVLFGWWNILWTKFRYLLGCFIKDNKWVWVLELANNYKYIRHATIREAWVWKKNKYIAASFLELGSLGEVGGGGCGGALSPPAGPWQSPGGGRGGEAPGKFGVLDP